MIHNIAPYQCDITYQNIQPQKDDKILVFIHHQLLLHDQKEISFLNWEEFQMLFGEYRVQYLFAVDDEKFFYAHMEEIPAQGKHLRVSSKQDFRHLRPKHLAFAAVTAFMLDGWYSKNKFCGSCGKALVSDEKERMLRCPHCGNMVYPRINPAVIVAVTDGNRLLMTKYNGRAYKDYALVAGFNEVGESLEDTVKREVMEETGLKVKNIRYYGSQPWAFSDNILAGYFCDLDGSDKIVREEEELSVAVWMEKEDIKICWDDISLTNEMMCVFKGEYPMH